MTRKVYFVSDKAMLLHRCEWDDYHIEVPERLSSILDRLEKSAILNRCERLESRVADIDEIKLVHDEKYIQKIAATAEMNMAEQENLASTFDDVYFNKHTYDAALYSAGCSIQATEAVLTHKERCDFAMAAVRPPGHHASKDVACGFCFFNNAAICAKKARKLGAERVLIVDWDVHAGQGTQYSIADDPSIKLVSIHRFEHGRFWPYLPESGIENEYPNTLNLPLNVAGLGDNEYVAFIQHIAVPVVNDFKPSLIIVSSGFDAAFGDDEGSMLVTPGGYYWMMRLLANAAIQVGSPMCVLLEGGYFLDSLMAGVEFCMKALLGDPGPLLEFGKCDRDFLHSLHCLVMYASKDYPSLSLLYRVTKSLREARKVSEIKRIKREYRAVRLNIKTFATRKLYHRRPRTVVDNLQHILSTFLESYTYDDTTIQTKLVEINSTGNSEADESVCKLKLDGPVGKDVINFFRVHIFNAPCTGLKLLENKGQTEAKGAEETSEKSDDGDGGTEIRAICSGLEQLFSAGLSKNFEHFLLFDAKVEK